MKRKRISRSRRFIQRQARQRTGHSHSNARPRSPAAYRQRGTDNGLHAEPFNAPELWHEPTGEGDLSFNVQPAGKGYLHAATVDEIHDRILELPEQFTRSLEVVQLSRMTRKRALFPCYGMQWGPNVYLYPIEDTFVETYYRTPAPQQFIDAEMYGGKWTQDGYTWYLEWTEETIRDFYLNNVLIHEIGHVIDHRNSNFEARERYANWFAIEYGYRASRDRI